MNVTIDNIHEVFLLIADLFSNFKPPVTEMGNLVWLDLLGGRQMDVVVRAVKAMVAEEQFFSFAKLQQKIEEISLGPVMSKIEVSKAIIKLIGNYDAKIGDQPDIVQLTIDYAGGLRQIQMMDAQWQDKHLSDAYNEAIKEMRKSAVKAISAPAERLALNE